MQTHHLNHMPYLFVSKNTLSYVCAPTRNANYLTNFILSSNRGQRVSSST